MNKKITFTTTRRLRLVCLIYLVFQIALYIYTVSVPIIPQLLKDWEHNNCGITLKENRSVDDVFFKNSASTCDHNQVNLSGTSFNDIIVANNSPNQSRESYEANDNQTGAETRNRDVCFIFAIKPSVQLFANILFGPLTNRYFRDNVTKFQILFVNK